MPEENEQNALSKIKAYLGAGHSLDEIRQAGWASWIDLLEAKGYDLRTGELALRPPDEPTMPEPVTTSKKPPRVPQDKRLVLALVVGLIVIALVVIGALVWNGGGDGGGSSSVDSARATAFADTRTENTEKAIAQIETEVARADSRNSLLPTPLPRIDAGVEDTMAELASVVVQVVYLSAGGFDLCDLFRDVYPGLAFEHLQVEAVDVFLKPNDLDLSYLEPNEIVRMGELLVRECARQRP